MVAAIRNFAEKVDGLRQLGLETELQQVVAALISRATTRAAILARTGLSGTGPVTLELASQAVGVTRERVRQMEKAFKEHVGEFSGIWTPVLDLALQRAGELVPVSRAALMEALNRAGLIGDSFALESLIAAAEIFGKKLPFTVMDEILAPPGDWAPSSIVRKTARRLLEHWGATTVTDLEMRLKEDGFKVDRRLLLMTLETVEGFRWLDQEQAWFWIQGSRNRLLRQIQKIMAVAGSIELSELRSGVGRHHRMKGFRPPREVLASLCINSGDYSRLGDRISGGANLPDWQEVLGDNERKLAQALFDHGPVMRRDDLEQVVVTEGGMNRSSFYVYLTYSPIIERYAPGVYGLRGARATAAKIDAMIPQRVRHQVLQDHGWTEAGWLWAAFRLSPAAVGTGIMGAPAAVRAVAKGAYELVTEDERPVGTLVIDQNMWGLSPYFRRWGVEAGDMLVIALDLTGRKAKVAVGTDELLLKYQSGE